MGLDGRVAIVTGGARGIGLETGRWLAHAGARVLLVDVEGGAATEAARALAGEGLTAEGQAVDVTSPGDVRAMVARTLALWARVDILVNNAGICPVTAIDDISVAEWDQVLGINLKGPFLCSQAVIPTMRAQHSGKIVNIASSAGQMGGLAVGVHYSASKAGVLGLTKALARILAPDIQVNAVAPGTTESRMTADWEPATTQRLIHQIPAGRLGQPADVAAAVVFLASDEASFITGQTISVNGGLLMV
ncbi:MAG: 3-oxoacyl-ACP reductase FabG [Anaerolineales bacterium]|nr:3-oxoacyl-ACP reductase FabG [Anaerolineales bacterium]